MAILRCFLKGCIFELWFPAWNSNQRKRKNPAKIPGVLRAGCEVQVYWTLMCEVRWLDGSVPWDVNLNQQQKGKSQNSDECKKSWNGSWIKWIIFQCQHQLDFFLYKNRTLHFVLVSTFLIAALPRIWVEQWHVNMLMILLWYSENSEDHPSQGVKWRKVFKRN